MLEFATIHRDASVILCPSLLHVLCQLTYNATARAKVGGNSLSKMGNPMGNDTPDQAQHAHTLPSPSSPTPIPLSDALATAFADAVRPWQVAPELSSAALDAVTHATNITNLQAQLLENRGIHGAAAAQRFLAGDWRGGAALPNLAAAVTRLRQATRTGERIVVFGDYDSDGMTSCAILLLALRALGAQATPYIPRRDDNGRGLNIEAVDLLANQGAQLIVTTDCGSANVAEVARARELGIEVIVTDHHPPYGELPDCLIVNPQLGHADAAPTDATPASHASAPTQATQATRHEHANLADLSGAGVAFHLAEALLTAPANDAAAADETDDISSQSAPLSAPRLPTLTDAEATAALASLLDLVVIGTIGDVVPLTPHNWALAHAGLVRLRTQPRIGLLALLASAGIAPGQATERDIAFAIAPRLNAAARLGQPETALRLLICDDDVEAIQLASQLESLNQERQRITDQVMAVAREQARAQVRTQPDIRPSLVFVVGEGWPLGIIGLVAGRLVDEYGCAAVTLSRMGDECRGSARGPLGVNLVAALAERPDFFRRFGGHARAAGFTIATADVEALREYLAARLATMGTTAHDEAAQQDAGAETVADATQPMRSATPEVLDVDCRLPLDRVTLQKYAELRRLAPYGAAFTEPQFVWRARIVRCWQSGVERRNLRLAIRDASAERVFLWSRQGAICDDLRAAIPRLPAYDVVYTFDAYQRPDGEPQLTARIVALRPAPVS